MRVIEPEASYTAAEGEVITHGFHVQNVGSAPLELTIKCSDCEVRESSGEVSWRAPWLRASRLASPPLSREATPSAEVIRCWRADIEYRP